MAKAIKTAVKVFVVTFAITTGLALAFNSAGLFALGQVGLTGAFLGGISTLSIAALTAASTLVNGLMSKGTDATIENFGTKVASRSSASPRQIVYGRARVGGAITHIETSGTDNYKLSMIVVLAGHEIESLEEVLINDTKLTTTSSGGFQYATNSRFINTDNENNFGSGRLLRYKFKDGSQTTADSTITSATSLGSTDKFIGMAYMLIEMVFDSEAFGGGIPPLAFVIKGKKVYDPRTSTTAWSDNPALCVRDYITDTTYGLKATSDEVLDTTALGGFAAAANTCDSAAGAITTATVNGAVSNLSVVQIDPSVTNTLIDVGQTVTGTGISGTVRVIYRSGNLVYLNTTVSVADGVTLTFNEELYKANGITNMTADGSGVLEGLLSSCAGKLSYINGKFVMFAGASVTPDMTITDDNLLAPISVQTKNSGGETFNTVKAVYVDGNNNYVATDSPTETTVNPATSNTFLSEDTPSGESQANYRKTLEIQLPFTDNTTMAQRLQRTALLHSRQEVSLSVLCNIAFMQLQPFDWVYLTNSRLGYTNKTFEVLSTNLEVIESDDVPVLATRLVLKEIDSSVYAFASSSYTNPIDEGSSVSTGSFSVTAPTGLSLTVDLQLDSATSKVNIDASWTNNPDDLIQGTEILYGTASGTYIGSVLVGKGKTKAVIPNLLSNSTYYVVARHFSSNNVFSNNTAEQSVGTGLPAAPSAPTNLSATTGKALVIGLEWNAPSNSDLRAVKVYRHTSSFTPTDDTYLVSTITSEPSETQKITFGLEDGLTAGTTYHFAVRAINFSGTHSTFTSTTTGSFTLVDVGDIDLPDFSGYFHKEGNTTTALTSSQFNTEYGRTPLNDDILVMVNTSASPKVSKAYKWNGSAFVEITNFTTGDLVVDGTLAGSKIIAGDISADRVDADFVSTLNLLTTSATITNNITIGTGNNVFKAETGVGIQLGHATFGSAPFRVTEGGALTATNATITGEVNATSGTFNGSIAIGSGNSIFKADSNGIYLGNATFGSAPFRVTPAGDVTATSATITGTLTLTNIDGTTVTYTGGTLGVGTIGSGNLGDSAIFPATLRYERTNSTSAPSNSEFNTAFGRNPKANDIVVVVRTDNNSQVAYKHNGTAFAVINNYIDGDLIVDGTITATQIEGNTITANEIATGTLTSASGVFGSISASDIDTGTLNAANVTISGGDVTINSSGITINGSSSSINLGSGAFTVSSSGALTATNATITGAITATSGSFAGSLSSADGTFTGTLSGVDGTFSGSLSSASGTFTGALSGGTISIGSGNSIFKADSNGIYLGNATFGSAPFRVTPAGELTATSVTVTGKYNAKSISGTGQAGLFSQLSDSVTGGSDPLRILCPSDDSDKDFFILMGNDPYSMSFSSGIPTSANHGLWFTGTGSIYMGGTNDSFSPLADNSNDLGRLNNRWDDVYATNGTIQTSDANDKSNIADSDLGLSFVSQLTPRKYTLNDGDSSRTHYGLIAQEVKTVLDNNNINTSDFAPYIKGEILDTSNQGTGQYKYGLRYTEFISILIKAIKELEQRVQDLES